MASSVVVTITAFSRNGGRNSFEPSAITGSHPLRRITLSEASPTKREGAPIATSFHIRSRIKARSAIPQHDPFPTLRTVDPKHGNENQSICILIIIHFLYLLVAVTKLSLSIKLPLSIHPGAKRRVLAPRTSTGTRIC